MWSRRTRSWSCLRLCRIRARRRSTCTASRSVPAHRLRTRYVQRRALSPVSSLAGFQRHAAYPRVPGPTLCTARNQDTRIKLQKVLENAELGAVAYAVTTSELLERLESDMLRAVRAQLYPSALA